MNRFLFRLLSSAAFILASVWAVPATAQESRCASCHFANPDSPRQDHLQNWDSSPHDRANVGCEKCHGGNATTFESQVAHRDVINSASATSPVNRRNLPQTCGTCHSGPFTAFQESRHFQLLQSGNNKGPTCSTCHGAVDGRLLSAKALASQCNSCHGPGEIAPRAERARLVREQYDGLATVRQELKLAQNLIKRVSDVKRRAALNDEYQQAEVPLTRAVYAGHKFVYDDLRQNLGVAEQRAQALLTKLANR